MNRTWTRNPLTIAVTGLFCALLLSPTLTPEDTFAVAENLRSRQAAFLTTVPVFLAGTIEPATDDPDATFSPLPGNTGRNRPTQQQFGVLQSSFSNEELFRDLSNQADTSQPFQPGHTDLDRRYLSALSDSSSMNRWVYDRLNSAPIIETIHYDDLNFQNRPKNQTVSSGPFVESPARPTLSRGVESHPSTGPFFCFEDLYFSALVSGSGFVGSSGGFNTEGLFQNSGSDEGFKAGVGGAVGVSLPKWFGTLRLEAEGRWRSVFNARTDSEPTAMPPFIYDVELTDTWSTMGNIWFDKPLNDHWDIYFGGGVGVAGHQLSITDGVVQGAGGGTDLSWQVGAGLNYHLAENITLDLGYRYVDLGEANIGLSSVPFGTPAGNYKLDLESHDVMFTVRVTGWPFAGKIR